MKTVTSPADLSPEATRFYENVISELPCIDFTCIDQVRQLRDACTPLWQNLSDQIPYAYSFNKTSVNGVTGYLTTPPESLSDELLVVYLHGGSYLFGHPTLCRNIPVSVAHHSGIRVLSVEYPLAPEHPFPAPVNQVLRLIEGLAADFPEVSHYALMGHSAGGGLALSATLEARNHGFREPSALALIAPWVDIALEGDSMQTLENFDPNPPSYEWFDRSVQAFIGNLQRKDPLVSPLYGKLDNLCPTYIQQPGRDRLLSDAARLNRRLLANGVAATLDIWEGLWHGFQMYPMVPEAMAANRATAGFLQTQLSACLR